MRADREALDARLRALHDDYVWKVNAAVAEGRDDLVRRLSDEYVEEAAHLLADEAGEVCACARCRGASTGSPSAPPSGRPRRRWLGFLGGPAELRPRRGR